MGLGFLSAAELAVMRRLIESERDVRIAQKAPRTLRERKSLGQVVHRELQRMRRIQLHAAGLYLLDRIDGFKEGYRSLVPGSDDKGEEGHQRKAAQECH